MVWREKTTCVWVLSMLLIVLVSDSVGGLSAIQSSWDNPSSQDISSAEEIADGFLEDVSKPNTNCTWSDDVNGFVNENGVGDCEGFDPYLDSEAGPENTCDCGPHSKGCKIQDNKTICDCEYKYRQEDDKCKAFCRDYWQCDNGASCVNESCDCLPGTSGDHCGTVGECEGMKGPIMCGDPEIALCRYDVKNQKPDCMCRIYDFIYHPPLRKCIECDCGKFGTCSLVNGKKQCVCNKGAALRQVEYWGDIVDRCEECKCGNTSDGCSFEGLYKKHCNCPKGTSQQPGLYGDTCTECNCGDHGRCYFEAWYRYCECEAGYRPFLTINSTDLYCKECDCGKNGACSFSNEIKQCKCNKGYAERDGKCTACQCYADGKTVNCTFTNRIQTCICPDGYERSKFFCQDIDECLNGNNTCPPSTTNCVNTMGSYECVCKDGYEPRGAGYDPKVDGCYDIDECEDPKLCPPINTYCRNLLGSYECVCKRGYVPVKPNDSPKIAGCERESKKSKDESQGWRTGLIILAVVVGVCIVGIGAAIFIRRRNARSSVDRDTSFQTMR